MRSYEERECNNNMHNVNESAANVSQVWYHKKPTDSDERANKEKTAKSAVLKWMS